MDETTIRLLVDKIAESSIGNSTLRGQGAAGVNEVARQFLKKIDLNRFSKSETQKEFQEVLDLYTKKLKKGFPEGARNWGAARKAINIFLRGVVYNRHTRKFFTLSHIEKWLEIPLDSNVGKGLRMTKYASQLPNWKSIKSLTPEISSGYQLVAKKVAKQLGIKRIHLDIYLWRYRGIEYIKYL